MNMGSISVLLVLMAVAFVAYGAPVRSDAKGETGNLPKGKIIFIKYCAGCHGPEDKGDGYRLLGPDPANLTSPSTMEKPDSELLSTIHEGKPNMPSWKGLLSEGDIHNVLAYVRTLPKQLGACRKGRLNVVLVRKGASRVYLTVWPHSVRR
jgi:mono/diheme cytochrome c family protein